MHHFHSPSSTVSAASSSLLQPLTLHPERPRTLRLALARASDSPLRCRRRRRRRRRHDGSARNNQEAHWRFLNVPSATPVSIGAAASLVVLASRPNTSEIRFLKSENRSANEGLTEGRSTSLCLAESPEAPEQAETGSEESKNPARPPRRQKLDHHNEAPGGAS